jgi:hypothetical protein
MSDRSSPAAVWKSGHGRFAQYSARGRTHAGVDVEVDVDVEVEVEVDVDLELFPQAETSSASNATTTFTRMVHVRSAKMAAYGHNA